MKLLLFKAHEGDPLSLAIKEVTQSDYCHAAVLIDPESPWRAVFAAQCGLDRNSAAPMIAELYYPQARARLLSNDELANIDVFEVRGWQPENEQCAMEYAAKVIRDEVKYDIPDLFRYLPIFRLVMGAASEDSANKHMFCSWFAFELCKAAGRPLLRTNGYEVAPNQIAWSNEVVQIPLWH